MCLCARACVCVGGVICLQNMAIISNVVFGSASGKATCTNGVKGIVAGDVILEVAGRRSVGLEHYELAKRIKDEVAIPGATTVELLLQKGIGGRIPPEPQYSKGVPESEGKEEEQEEQEEGGGGEKGGGGAQEKKTQ